MNVLSQIERFKKWSLEAILPSPFFRRCKEPIFDYEYVHKFKAINAKDFTLVLGTFAELIYTKKSIIALIAVSL
jgi:hypothetical protein